jgi:hypothetical protein
MTRNQLLPKYVKNLSGGVMFIVDGRGYITPTAQQTVYREQTIVTQADTSCTTTFSGHVCARQNDVCQCSTLVDSVSSGNHMVIGTGYTIKSSVALNSTFEIYAVTDSGPVAGASNGDIVIGTT